MSSYETLLENYAEEEKFSNVTFAEMGSILESLTEFVNEEVELTVEISLQEAEDETIKDKAGKIGAAVSKHASALVEKLKQFITKISDAVRAFVAKARKTIADCGNVALKKMLANRKMTLAKPVKLVVYDENAIKPLFKKANDAVEAVNKIWGTFEIGGNIADVPSEVESAREAFKQKLDKSSLGKVEEHGKGVSVNATYDKYVGKLLKLVDENIKPIQSGADKAKAAAKSTIAKLKKSGNANAGADISKVSALASAAMQMNTYAINFAASVLSIATKNAAKIALAAGATTAVKAGEKVKAAPGKAKEVIGNKADEIKAARADKKAAKEAEK